MAAIASDGIFPFNPYESSTTGPRWEHWVERLNNFFVVKGITENKVKRANLLHYAGDEVFSIFKSLPDTVDAESYDQAIATLNQHFTDKKNVDYERVTFRETKQEEDETMKQFHSRLRKLSKNCDFHSADDEIKTQIISRCRNHKIRQRALETQQLTLINLLDMANAMERSEAQASSIEKNIKSESNARESAYKVKKQYTKKTRHQQRETRSKKCYFCAGNYPHAQGRKSCPAFGNQCRNCGRYNHFSQCCLHMKQKKHVRQTEDNSESEYSDEEPEVRKAYVTICRHNKPQRKPPKVKLEVNDNNITFLLDTGAAVNIIDETHFKMLDCKLEKTNTKIYAYQAKKPLPVLGKITAEVKTPKYIMKTKMYVIKGKEECLLSYHTAEKLGLVVIPTAIKDKEEIFATHAEQCDEADDQEILTTYSDRFKGIGKLKGYKAKLHIDKTIQPVAQPHRRIPFHIRERVTKELEYLETNDIIEKISGPTPWVSPIVTPPKTNSPV
ncbi:uncharacterized protein LOC144749994 [Ciona intestinalis]